MRYRLLEAKAPKRDGGHWQPIEVVYEEGEGSVAVFVPLGKCNFFPVHVERLEEVTVDDLPLSRWEFWGARKDRMRLTEVREAAPGTHVEELLDDREGPIHVSTD